MVGVRGFLYRSVALTAMGAVTIGAVDTAMLNDQFNVLTIDGSADARVDAYIPLVAQTSPILNQRFNAAQQMRDVADSWISGFAHGKLKTIVPGYYGENILEGPKGEIVQVCLNLSKRLSALASREYQSGNYSKASEDAMRSMELLNMIRFSTPAVYTLTLAFYTRPLQTLNMSLKMKPNLPESMVARLMDKKTFRVYVEEMKTRDRNIQTQYAVRYGKNSLQSDGSQVQLFSPKTRVAAMSFAEIPGEKEAREQALACGFAPEE